MSYDLFLRVMSQIANKKVASLTVDDQEIIIEPYKKENHWLFRTTLYYAEEEIPSCIRSCISSSGVLRWQEKGAYLQIEEESHSVLLIQKIIMEKGKFIPFQFHINDFAHIATEWRGILSDLEEHSRALICRS
jgi:hypothetical protein